MFDTTFATASAFELYFHDAGWTNLMVTHDVTDAVRHKLP